MKKIIFIANCMNRWGTETYLMNVIRKLDKKKFDISILVNDSNNPGEYADELESLGIKIYSLKYLPKRLNIISYQLALYKFLKTVGPFDIIHANHTELNGYYLPAAYFAKVPIRISHSHNDNSKIIEEKDIFWKFIFSPLLKFLGNFFCTKGITISENAGKYLYGKNWYKNPKIEHLHCGLDFIPFSTEYKTQKTDFCKNNDIVLICTGRFFFQKNHSFVIDVAHDLIKNYGLKNLKFIFAGDGELRGEIEKKISDLELTEYFLLLGSRNDIPALLKNVADIFLFPSLFEGLGLAYIEAQCAGLVCLVSEAVPKEGDILEEHLYRLSIEQGSEIWSRKLVEIIKSMEHKKINKEQSYSLVMESTFNIDVHMSKLLKLYGE